MSERDDVPATDPTPADPGAPNGTDEAAVGSGPVEVKPAPVDHVSAQLTIRAVITGMLLGGTLSICNVYLGLRIGWGTNMSITGILLAYAFWETMRASSGGSVKRFGVLENNINQSACSAAAAVSSAGLVAPIPALTMITGETLPWHWLALWVFAVCLVGITVATGLRRQMIVVDRLPFPSGTACAETLREIHGVGKEAMERVRMLGAGAIVAATMKILELTKVLKAVAVPGSISTGIGGGKSVSLGKLGFELEPSLLMVGVGGLIGMRAAASIMLGAILAWAVIGPMMVSRGHAELTTIHDIAILPEGVELGPEERLQWRAPRFRLEQLGPMADDDRDRFLAMSDDANWRETIERIHRASRLDERDRVALGPWTTTVPMRRSVPLTGPLALVDELEIPQPLRRIFIVDEEEDETPGEGSRHADGDRPRMLMSFGAPPAEAFAELRRRIDVAVLADREDDATSLRVLLAGAERLRDSVPNAVAIPDSVAEAVHFDSESGLFVVVGELSDDDGAAILEANAALDAEALAHLDATLERIVETSALDVPEINFGDLLNWLLWPGVTLMVVSSLVSFSFSWRSMLRAFRGGGAAPAPGSIEDQGDLSRRWFLIGACVALLIAVVLQMSLFAITWWAAIIGVLLSFALAVVASRVAGETNITPVGAMGKVTQLIFGVMVPKNAAANLMSANVTGGAASQCADLMHDFKCGWLLGASPRKQYVAQVAGALAGAMVGSLFYLILIPDPGEMLMTEEWPAPAVAAWKAVAELFMIGLEALPSGTVTAMIVAGIAGILLPVIDRLAPRWLRTWVPSAASVGLAFVVSPKFAVSMFLGASIALALAKYKPKWTTRFLVTICAGIIVGDSLVGAGDAIRKVLGG